MLDKKELRAAMARKGLNNSGLAEVLGVSTRTISNRFKNGDFGANEIEIIIKALDIQDPIAIFFANSVT